MIVVDVDARAAPVAKHLWQSTLVAGAAGVLTLTLSHHRARARHGDLARNTSPVEAGREFEAPRRLQHLCGIAQPAARVSSQTVVIDRIEQPDSSA